MRLVGLHRGNELEFFVKYRTFIGNLRAMKLSMISMSVPPLPLQNEGLAFGGTGKATHFLEMKTEVDFDSIMTLFKHDEETETQRHSKIRYRK